MDPLKQAIEALMNFRHPEGNFSPYPSKAIVKCKKLCRGNLEEAWWKPINRHINQHTWKVIEVLQKFAPAHEVITEAMSHTDNSPIFAPSYEDTSNELRTGMFTKLIVTHVDSTLYAMLLGYTRITQNNNTKDKALLQNVRKKIITSIQHHDSIVDTSKLAWALYLWARDTRDYDIAFNELADRYKQTQDDIEYDPQYGKSSLQSWQKLMTICLDRLSGDTNKYVAEFPLPDAEIKEFYGGSCRSTAYTFLNLKRILKLYKNESGAEISEATNKLFSWIKTHNEKYHKNPYLSALYLECLYENASEYELAGMKTIVASTLKNNKGQRHESTLAFTKSRIIIVVLGLLVTIAVIILLVTKQGTGSTFLTKANSIAVVMPIASVIFIGYAIIVLGGLCALNKWFHKKLF